MGTEIQGLDHAAQEETERTRRHHRMLHRLRRLAGVRGILSGGRLQFWVPDEDSTPFGRIAVDPILCIGCKKCLSKGPDGCFLDGCPWDAIAMVETTEVEKEVGAMAI